MFMPPLTKKALALMSGQRDVGARAEAAPTGAAATGGVPTPFRQEPWPRPQTIPKLCGSKIIKSPVSVYHWCPL